ncbi:MAG: hypothetical protein U0694_27885 [Anaerolineae bacterium]
MTSVNISWHDAAHTILYTEYDGVWTWDDFHNAVTETVAIMQQVDYRVDLIVAPSPQSVMPHGSASPHFIWAIQMLPPNFGIQVIVTHNRLSRSMGSIFVKVFRRMFRERLFFATNMEQAYALIMKHREAKQPELSTLE